MAQCMNCDRDLVDRGYPRRGGAVCPTCHEDELRRSGRAALQDHDDDVGQLSSQRAADRRSHNDRRMSHTASVWLKAVYE